MYPTESRPSELPQPRFEIYEIVCVDSDDPSKAPYFGAVGEVKFRRYFDEYGWYYTVKITPELIDAGSRSRELWDFTEQDLRSTGEMSQRYWLEWKHPAKFTDYEKVIILPKNPDKVHLHGQPGCINGRSQHTDGTWQYAVYLYRDARVYMFEQDELATTGEFDSPENLMSDAWIRVKVNEDATGEIISFDENQADGEQQPEQIGNPGPHD